MNIDQNDNDDEMRMMMTMMIMIVSNLVMILRLTHRSHR